MSLNNDFNKRVISNIHTLNIVKNNNTLLRCNIFGLKNNTYTLSNHLVQSQFLFLFLVKQGRILIDDNTKDRILKLILCHDLGELIVGDTPSPSKNKDFRDLENIYYRELSSNFINIDDLNNISETDEMIIDYIDGLELLIECSRLEKEYPDNQIITETLLQLKPFLFKLDDTLVKLGILKRIDSSRTVHDDLLINMKLRESYASWH